MIVFEKNIYNMIIGFLLTLLIQNTISQNCNYISSINLLSLSNPEQQTDVKLSETIYTGKENIGYGFWMKYQPFIEISEIKLSYNQDKDSFSSSSVETGDFLYLLQQKETEINMVLVYAIISSITKTITHEIYYSFKNSVQTISFTFDNLQYEGRWILFYMYVDFVQIKTFFGFHYQLDSSTYFELQTVNDVPSLVYQIRHKVGGTKYITLNTLTLSLSQFKGRLTNIFSEGQIDIFQDIDALVTKCYVESTCQAQEKDLTGFNLAMLAQSFLKNEIQQIEYQIYVLNGWIKLNLLEDVYQKETIIFRLTIIKDYSNDMNIGDKQLYLKYIQNFLPEQNGFTLTTYSYTFPVSGMYQTTSTDIITVTGKEYQDYFINWHYIQFETGTNNNNGEPIFSIYFPYLQNTLQYTWSKDLYYFTGVILYTTIGGDSFSSDYMDGYISNLILTTYCETPIITLNIKCHYSCLTCNGPTLSNCLSCPLNSNRVQSIAQQTCTCKNSYIDIENDPICQAANEKFPQMIEIEYELQCNEQGYDDCQINIECSFGYFKIDDQCIQCPGYSSYNTKNNFLCSNCLFYPTTFAIKLSCLEDIVTYNSEEDNAYYIVKRQKSQIDLYKITTNKQQQYELILEIGKESSYFCKDGYLQQSNECKPCIQGCQNCQDIYTCQTCYYNYSLTKDFTCQQCQGCSTCSLSGINIICTQCEQGMYLLNDTCVSCGKNCASCNSSGICYYCDDPKKYYLTFDGQNCSTCSIKFCQFCYQYYILNGVTHTTLDIEFTILNLNQLDFIVGCALCENNLYYNILTNLCENKPQTTIEPSDPSTGGGGGGGGGMEDCSFGLILNADNETFCLISSTNKKSTQINDCLFLNNCKSCIENYSSSTTYCMVCADGYYSHILTGECKQCITTCRTCVQQNTIYNDSWKWKIKPYYKYVFNSDDTHPFEIHATSTSEINFEIICVTCNKGYRLYKNDCIADCDEDCTLCDIIDNKSVCIQCLETPFGFLKSKDENGICLQCPNYCAACFDRSLSEITSFNPYFSITTYNQKYTRICYERFDIDLADGEYFFDSLLRTVTVCSSYNKCYYKTIIQFNLYCSIEEFKQQAMNDMNFEKKNNYIEAFFDSKQLIEVENQGFFTYLNNKGVRYLEYEYTLIQGNAEGCQIPIQSQLLTTVQQNVFSIQSVSVSFIGSKSQTILKIYEDVTFTNFTSITFQNILFDSYMVSQNRFVFQNLLPIINLKITDCIFTSYNQSSQLIFYSVVPYSLEIENVILFELSLFASSLFQLNVNKENLINKIKITNLKIINSKFQQSSILNIISIKYDFLSITTTIKDVFIYESSFTDSSFLTTTSELMNTAGTIDIQNFIVNKTSLENSQIFSIPSAKMFTITNIIVLETKFQKNSYFLKSNIIQNYIITFENTVLQDSFLYSNDVDYTTSEIALANSANIFLSNMQILQLQYNNSKSIMNLINYGEATTFTVTLDTFVILESIFTSIFTPNYISYESSLMYLECQICIIKQMNIIRGYGFPELAILNSKSIFINTLSFTLSSIYYSKTLHSSFECVQIFSNTNMFYFLYIGEYQNVTMTNVQVQNSIVYNSPFIIFKGYELMQITQNENIQISDSSFKNNMLIISKQNRITSIIQFTTEQECIIILNSVQFINNHLNEYFQDLTRESASTILISLQQGKVFIKNSLFQQNLATNTTDSILLIKSNQLYLINSKFYKNNIFQVSKISQVLLLSQDQYNIHSINFVNTFTISSKSGNGLLISTEIYMRNIVVNTSYANFGGGFYINTQGTGILTISDSIFYNTITSLSSSSFSKGGCLYIDAQLSKLNFTLTDTIFNTTISRVEGGAIYINPSQTSNLVYFQNLEIIDSYSITNSFFSYILLSLSNIESEIVMINLQFNQNQQGFENYLSMLTSLSDSDVQQIQNDNPLIRIRFGNLSFENITFQSMHIQYLINLEQPENVIINDLYVEKSTILYSPLIKISFRQNYISKFILNRIKILNVSQFKQLDNQIISDGIYEASVTLVCPEQLASTEPELSDYDPEVNYFYNLHFNKYLIYENVSYSFSLIEIDNVNSSHTFEMDDIYIDNVNCSECEYGLFRVYNIFQMDQPNIKLNRISITNSICGSKGCLALIQSESKSAIRDDLDTRLLQQHDYTVLSENFTHQSLISKSNFQNNYASYGGGIFIINIATLLKDCRFENNNALIGGAIYYYSTKVQLQIFESEIIQNTAKIAGGLYLNQQSLQSTKQLDVYILNNNSTLYGQDIYESPRSLSISYDGDQNILLKKIMTQTSTSVEELVVITPFKILGFSNKTSYLMYPSGRAIGKYEYFDQYQSKYIPYNLTLRIIALNKQNMQEKKLESSASCTLDTIIYNAQSGIQLQGFIVSLSYSQVKFNQTSGDFNLDDLIIYFNPTYDDDIILRLKISCNMISIPQYSKEPPYQIDSYINNYTLYVDIKTFPCQLGEFLNTTSGGCVLCDINQNQYQVEWNAQSCLYKDDLKMNSIASSMIELRPYYWRAYYYSQTIEYCYHLKENCKGGWSPGDESCIYGHIGALCEQCDLYDVRGGGSYSISSQYSCGSCDEVIGNVLTIFFISIWTLVSILMSVSSTVDMIEEFIIGLRLKAFGVTVVIKSASTAILIKVFTNYLQIVSTISTFQLQVPSELASLVNSVGNPIESMAYSLDCFLISVTDILIIYFRIIWSLMMATSYITVFFSLSGLAILLKSIKFNFSYITTSLIYVFIYLQPNLIGGLISLVSYRIISDQYWIQGNVAYRYNTFQHAKWLITFCFPLLVLFAILIPTFFWYGVYVNKHRLDLTQTRQKWGYLYNEYKLHAYFWETIKILQKELIIIVLAYYEDHIPIKASLVFIVLFGYSFYTTKKKPYMTGDLNYLDTQSTIVCAVSIILGSSIYTAQQSNLLEIVWPFYIIIGILNALFIAKMLSKILFAYFVKLNDQIDKIKDIINAKFPNLMKKHPIIKELFESKKKQQERIKSRFNKLRMHLIPQAKKILEFKKINNYDLPGRLKTELSESQSSISPINSKSGHSCVNSPIAANEAEKCITQLIKKPSSSKVYPELQKHNLESQISNIHQIEI